MKTIRLLAFRGTGPDPAYAGEDDLIRARHVGIQLEDDPVIYGFHPTPEAVAEIGGTVAAQRWLSQHNSLEGAISDDTDVFFRAAFLADEGAPITIFQMEYRLDDPDFDIIRAELQLWWAERRTANYQWPQPRKRPMPDDYDNCATFPRRLGLPIPEPTGRLKYYIDAMLQARSTTVWKPEAR